MTSLKVYWSAFSLFIASLLSVTPNSAFATGVSTKVGADGKLYTVARPGTQYLRVECEKVKFNLLTQHLENQKPSLIATVISNDGSKRQTVRLINELAEHINDKHSIVDMRVGCLSGDGGLGIILNSIDNSAENAFIQIDNYGRVFNKFNQTGYILN